MSAFGIGVPELIIVFVIALIVFGPRKLPELGAGLGRAIREFKKTSTEITSEFTREMEVPDSNPQVSKQDSKGEGDENKAT